MKRTRRTAQHHIFEECAKLVSDPFWKEILTSSSHNKFPSGFMYKEGYLTHKRGKKTSKTYISSSPEEALEEIISFFQEKDQIYSKEDKEREDEILHEERVIIEEIQSWSQLKKKKKLLEVLLSQFILETTRHYGLEGKREKDQLTTLINIANLRGYLSDKTVIIQDNKIVDIIGLEVRETFQQITFHLPLEHKKIITKSSSRRKETSLRNKTGVNFYSLWLEFLQFYSR